MKINLLFEQSGTFKNVFKELGYQAFDYDLLNEFNETDYIIDLFKEIDNAYNNEKSIFDNIDKDDLTLAFFPCTLFEVQQLLNFRGDNYGFRNWCETKKLEYNIKKMEELKMLYINICKLAHIFISRKLKLIIENPYSDQHFLIRYWSIKPKLIIQDRRVLGDYYKKPTMFYFINCKPNS